MTTANELLVTTVRNYCESPVSPEYALLVRGAWGSGKTHLVKECVETIKAEKEKEEEEFKFLMVSLYGMASVSDIESAFFEQMHPVLSSKGMTIAGKVMKGFLKGTIKYDWDEDGKADGSQSMSLPDISLDDFAAEPTGCVLIFDDLERCDIELNLLLGYLNYFVEKQGYKLILIGDETRLIEKLQLNGGDASEAHYQKSKEKLIGKTIEATADIEAVFTPLVCELTDSELLRQFFAAYKNDIFELFQRSDYNNLRTLRRSCAVYHLVMALNAILKNLQFHVTSEMGRQGLN